MVLDIYFLILFSLIGGDHYKECAEMSAQWNLILIDEIGYNVFGNVIFKVL